MTAKTKLNKTQREKILYSVFMAMGQKAHEETLPDVERAFSATYAEFYTKIYGKAGTEADKAFHALAKRNLIETHISVDIKSVLSTSSSSPIGWATIRKDSGLAEFESVTQFAIGQGSGYLAGKHIGYRGAAKICDNDSVKLARQYPDVMIKHIQYLGDQFIPLRERFFSRMVQALDIYKVYAAAAIQIRAVVMNAKFAEDLKADLPDIADVVDTVINKPLALPSVVTPELTKTLKKLKPIEVAK